MVVVSDDHTSYWSCEHDSFWTSGFVGPFGGPWPSIREQSELNHLPNHLNEVAQRAKAGGANGLRVRLAPKVLWPSLNEAVTDVLSDLGWIPTVREIGHTIHLSEWSYQSLNRNRTRDLKRLNQLDYRILDGEGLMSHAYDVLLRNRMNKNLTNPISLRQLTCIKDVLGKSCKVSLVFDNMNRGVAAGLVLGLDSRIAYVAQWGHVDSLDGVSPMTPLAIDFFEWAKSRNFEILYLGVSSLEGHLDEGLARFKESLGSRRTETTVWEVTFT